MFSMLNELTEIDGSLLFSESDISMLQHASPANDREDARAQAVESDAWIDTYVL